MAEPMYPIQDTMTWKDKLRNRLPLIFIILAILLILNFIITFIYIKSNNDLAVLLRTCDPIKLCHPGGG